MRLILPPNSAFGIWQNATIKKVICTVHLQFIKTEPSDCEFCVILGLAGDKFGLYTPTDMSIIENCAKVVGYKNGSSKTLFYGAIEVPCYTMLSAYRSDKYQFDIHMEIEVV